MKVIVKEKSKTVFSINLPLALLKSKFIVKFIAKKSNGVHMDIKELSKKIPTLYKEIRKYIKHHGHFNLVELKSSNGDEIIIKL